MKHPRSINNLPHSPVKLQTSPTNLCQTTKFYPHTKNNTPNHPSPTTPKLYKTPP